MGLPLQWVRHLPQQGPEAKALEDTIRNSSTALGRLLDIAKEELDALNKTEVSEKQFEDPNWGFKQSYRNGQRSKILYFINLLSFLDQEK